MIKYTLAMFAGKKQKIMNIFQTTESFTSAIQVLAQKILEILADKLNQRQEIMQNRMGIPDTTNHPHSINKTLSKYFINNLNLYFMECAELILRTPPTAKWYIRVKLFFTFFRILPKWIGDKATAKKYIHLKLKRQPSGIMIDLNNLR